MAATASKGGQERQWRYYYYILLFCVLRWAEMEDLKCLEMPGDGHRSRLMNAPLVTYLTILSGHQPTVSYFASTGLKILCRLWNNWHNDLCLPISTLHPQYDILSWYWTDSHTPTKWSGFIFHKMRRIPHKSLKSISLLLWDRYACISHYPHRAVSLTTLDIICNETLAIMRHMKWYLLVLCNAPSVSQSVFTKRLLLLSHLRHYAKLAPR